MTTKLKSGLVVKPFRHDPFTRELKASVFITAQKKFQLTIKQMGFYIEVPATTSWDPATIQQLVTSLYAIPVPFTLGISANAGRLSWYLALPPAEQPIAAQVIYAIHPQSELRPLSDHPPRNFYRFPLHAAAPYVFPLKEIEDFNYFEPLATLLSAMRQVHSNERWSYELTLNPIEAVYRELGQQLLNEWLSKYGGMDAGTVQVIQDKLNAPLKIVRLALKIETDTIKRAHQLANSSWPTWMQFARNGFNALAVPGPQTFQLVLSPGEVAALWHLPSDQLDRAGITWAPTINLPIPDAMIALSEGIVLGTNSYQGRENKARLLNQDRDAHVTIIGKTGVGKSTLVHRMFDQDVKYGQGVGVLDPHGDGFDDILKCSITSQREADVVLFDTHEAKNYPIGLNPLTVPPGVWPHQVARQALDLIKKLCADDWPGAQTERYFAAALRALVEYPGATLNHIPRLLSDKSFRALVIAQLTDLNARQTWLIYDRLNAGAQARISDPILNRLDRFYNDPVLEQIICQPDGFDFRQLMDQKKIFLANLGAFQEEREANTLGALLLSKFQFAAMSRGNMSKAERQKNIYYLYIDELQRFNTASLPIIYDQARKYGLSLVGAFQRLSQLPSDDLRGIASGVGTLITFSPLRDDARTLAPFLDEQISAKDLADLSKYTAIVNTRLYGQTLPSFSIKTHEPLPENPDANQIITRIRRRSRTNDVKSTAVLPTNEESPNEDNNDVQENYFAG